MQTDLILRIYRICSLDNPLECDCEMHWYKKWWMGEWQSVDTDHIKDLTCRDPQSNEIHLMKEVKTLIKNHKKTQKYKIP